MVRFDEENEEQDTIPPGVPLGEMVFPLDSSVLSEYLEFHIKALSALARLRLLNVLFSTPRCFNPRRLEIILDLELK